MEPITDAALGLAHTRSVQNALNVIMSLSITSHIFMPEPCELGEDEYDYIVVGAGTAGAIAAGRLAQNKTAKVLLLEAGGDPPLQTIYPGLHFYVRSSPIHYNFPMKNDYFTHSNNRRCNYNLLAGKVLGGTSSINLMIYDRGNERDYDNWVSASKDQTWSLKNTLEFFKKTEKLEDPSILNSPYKGFHGIDGPLIVTKENRTTIDKYLEAFKEFNKIVLDLNSNETLGFSKSQYTIGNLRESSATAFLKASDKTPYLDLLKNTVVTKIIFDSNNNAIGVMAKRNNKMITFKAKKEIIISAGVVNTPKLLMLSGIGPKKHLESKDIKVKADLPVGENYHDHINVPLIHTLGKSCRGRSPDVDRRKYPNPLIIGYVALNKSRQYPDYGVAGYFLLQKYAAEFYIQSIIINEHYSTHIRNRIYKQGKGQKLLVSFIRNTIPKSRGKVLLRSSDYKDQPIIDARFYSNETDLEDYVDYLQDYIKLGNTKSFKEIGAKRVDPLDKECAEYKFGSRDYWKCYVMSLMYPTGHAVGTCAMGSVVDSKLKVMGVNRLRVADASVIPVITSGGTYAAAMMIGEKAADMILEQM